MNDGVVDPERDNEGKEVIVRLVDVVISSTSLMLSM
uniref:Uncharacterized protein n=1 Tax=Lepeophtheirus salmonis TaxID=72036 RepID=A0A0K2UXJ6_LEPSM